MWRPGVDRRLTLSVLGLVSEFAATSSRIKCLLKVEESHFVLWVYKLFLFTLILYNNSKTLIINELKICRTRSWFHWLLVSNQQYFGALETKPSWKFHNQQWFIFNQKLSLSLSLYSETCSHREAHSGAISWWDRDDHVWCVATYLLPVLWCFCCESDALLFLSALHHSEYSFNDNKLKWTGNELNWTE